MMGSTVPYARSSPSQVLLDMPPNAHRGLEQSRRDDLEALGHVFAYFLRGALPWSGLAAKTKEEKYRRIMEKKIETSLDDLFAGHPACFQKYLANVRALEYDEIPDYGALRRLFRDTFDQAGFVEDYCYDWCKLIDVAEVAPIGEWKCPPQPDTPQPQPKKKQGFGLLSFYKDACDAANKKREKELEERQEQNDQIRKVFNDWDTKRWRLR